MSDATEETEPAGFGVHVDRLSVSRRGIGVNVEASHVHMHVGGERARVPVQLPPSPLVGELIGRSSERAALCRQLAAAEDASVVGPAGLGKTALAAAALRDIVGKRGERLASSPFPDGIVLLDLYQLRAQPDQVFDALANAVLGTAFSDRPARERASEACRNKRLLVVFEGAEEADGREGRAQLAQLCEVLDPLNTRLILTRNLAQSIPGRSIKVEDALAPEAAAELLRRLTGAQLSAALGERVLELLQGHPLALTWAAGVLARGDQEPAYLADAWSNEALPSLSDPDPTRRQHTLAWLFERSTRSLEPKARELLVALGLLANAPFPLTAAERALSATAADARVHLTELVRAGLLRLASDDGRWSFTHALTYQFARRERGDHAARLARMADWLHRSLAELLKAESRASHAISHQLLHADALARCDDALQLWQPLLDGLLHDVCERLSDLGRLEQAASAIDVVYNWLGRLPEAHATHPEWMRERGIVSRKRGIVRREQGDLSAAHAALEHGRSLAAALAAEDDNDPERGWELSVCLHNLGNLQRDRGDYAGALRSLEQGYAILVKLVDAHPEDTRLQSALSLSLNHLGNLRRSRGDLTGAQLYFERSRELTQRLVSLEPHNIHWQSALSFNLNHLGNVQRGRGDLDGALACFSQSREIRAKLADSDPNNAQWQRDLSFSLNHLGGVQLARRELGAARSCLDQSCDIRARLAEANPSNAQWQRDLSVSLKNLARLAAQEGQHASALEHAQASLAIDTRLAELDPSNATWRKNAAISRAFVAKLERNKA